MASLREARALARHQSGIAPPLVSYSPVIGLALARHWFWKRNPMVFDN